MPKLRNAIPAYTLHKQSGRGMVRLSGRDVCLPGRYGSEESRAAYDRFIADWLANGRQLPKPAPASGESTTALTVDEIVLRYLDQARVHYRHRGTATSELGNIRDALRPLQALFGPTPAREFGPKRLKTLREWMISDGLTRPGINRRISRVLRMFQWAASEELIPPDGFHAMRTVSGLQRGRTPVPEAFVDAIRPHVSRQVWAMIQLQLLSGMRPGEVCGMRARDLDVSGPVRIYRPTDHKTAHRGRTRTIQFGPRAQAILRDWLRTNLDEPLFQPREAEAERKAAMWAARKTRVQPSQLDRSKPNPARRSPARPARLAPGRSGW